MAQDSVCKMTVDENSVSTNVYKGTTCYFCAVGWKETIEMEPEKYVVGSTEN